MKKTVDPLAGFLLPSAILIFDHLRRKLILSSILEEGEQKSLVIEVRRCLESHVKLPASGKSEDPVSNMSKADFCNMVEQGKEYIASGDVYQIVLSLQFQGETNTHPFQMYRALRMINPSPYMFYLDFKDKFQFLGSSPETMVRTENANGKKVILRPIAGTRRRGTNPEEDEKLEKELLTDQKEKAEHLMLLDLARNDLGRISETGTVKVSEFMKIERYSHVMHLVSTVEGTVKEYPPLLDLMKAVFPAGTVSGAPKIRAMQIIDELEPHSRNLYAGSVGYFDSNGDIDHCLAIRCLEHLGERYVFTAGAGIVADSVPENEYEEILSKAMALKTILTGIQG